MQVHANAKLGLAGRREVALAVSRGWSVRVQRRGFGVAGGDPVRLTPWGFREGPGEER
jgi:hypothetical protein